jgi:hypothetical protein
MLSVIYENAMQGFEEAFPPYAKLMSYLLERGLIELISSLTEFDHNLLVDYFRRNFLRQLINIIISLIENKEYENLLRSKVVKCHEFYEFNAEHCSYSDTAQNLRLDRTVERSSLVEILENFGTYISSEGLLHTANRYVKMVRKFKLSFPEFEVLDF